jgi:hypothetical protein
MSDKEILDWLESFDMVMIETVSDAFSSHESHIIYVDNTGPREQTLRQVLENRIKK